MKEFNFLKEHELFSKVEENMDEYKYYFRIYKEGKIVEGGVIIIPKGFAFRMFSLYLPNDGPPLSSNRDNMPKWFLDIVERAEKKYDEITRLKKITCGARH